MSETIYVLCKTPLRRNEPKPSIAFESEDDARAEERDLYDWNTEIKELTFVRAEPDNNRQ